MLHTTGKVGFRCQVCGLPLERGMRGLITCPKCDRPKEEKPKEKRVYVKV